jgi:protein CpxP
MDKMKKLLMIAALGAFSLSAVACGGPHHHREMTPERAKKMASWKLDDALDDIDATDRQREAVEAAKDRLIDRAFELRKDEDGTRESLKTQLLSDKPDKEAVHKLVDETVERWRAFAHEAADEALELNPQFDRKQRQAVAEMWEEHRR